MNNLDTQYQILLNTILEYGFEKKDRTGTGTKSIFGYTIRHNMQDGFPLLTTKKMAIKSMMTELKWFLKGDTNIKYLVDNGCNIWNGDAYKHYMKVYDIESRESHSGDKYLEEFHMLSDLTMDEFVERIKTNKDFAKKWGELGPIYGKQWKGWKEHGDGYLILSKNIDQISNLISDLKNNPDSRRLMVSAWNVSELDYMVLPPCHYGFQVYTRELTFDERYQLYMGKGSEYDGNAYGKISTLDILDDAEIPTRSISLMWNQRSVDTFLGLPFNIASYATLLMLISKEVNMVPEFLIGNLGDTHLYLNHLEQAKEQMSRDSFDLPKLNLTNCDIKNGEFEWELFNYESHPSIKAPLSN